MPSHRIPATSLIGVVGVLFIFCLSMSDAGPSAPLIFSSYNNTVAGYYDLTGDIQQTAYDALNISTASLITGFEIIVQGTDTNPTHTPGAYNWFIQFAGDLNSQPDLNNILYKWNNGAGGVPTTVTALDLSTHKYDLYFDVQGWVPGGLTWFGLNVDTPIWTWAFNSPSFNNTYCVTTTPTSCVMNQLLMIKLYGYASPAPSPSSSASPSSSPSPSVSASVSGSNSASTSFSASVTPSQSYSRSSSFTPSVSPSFSASITPSVSQSISASITSSPSNSPAGSASVTPSASFSGSTSPSITQSVSASVSTSASTSTSTSASLSTSGSVSVSPSISPSYSPSRSNSVSASISGSTSRSTSASRSTSISRSHSRSATSSRSNSFSPSPSITPSITPSPSPTPYCIMHFMNCAPLNFIDVYDINTGNTLSTAPVPANATVVLAPGGSLYDVYYQPSPKKKGYLHNVRCDEYCESYLLLC